MDISVVIVSWNVEAVLRDCLHSVFQSELGDRSLEAIVVDSASTDGTVTMIEAEFPQARVLAQSENVGFTRGNNIALTAARGRYLLLLNPDTVLQQDTISQMAGYLDTHAETGIVGPQTLNSDGTVQQSRWRFPDWRMAFWETPWIRQYAPKRLIARYEYAEYPPDAVHDVDWMQGSCLMARREIYDRIGGLDTGYVMFYEELDWCRRASDAGWKLTYIGKARMTHHGGKSTEQVGALKHIHYNQSKLRYFGKVYGRTFGVVLRVFLLATYCWQITLEWTKGLLGSQRGLRRERIATYWQVLRSGLRVR